MSTRTRRPAVIGHWSGWPLERVLFAMAGHDDTDLRAFWLSLSARGFCCLTAFVGVNQWLYVVVGDCSRLARPAARFRPPPGGLRDERPGDSSSARSAASAATPRTHVRPVAIAWIVIAVGLGFLAPRVETALSGAGWEATGSESVAARSLIEQQLRTGIASSGLMVVLHSPSQTVTDPAFSAVTTTVAAHVKADPAVASVAPPRPGVVDLAATATRRSSRPAPPRTRTQMVRAADRLKGPLQRARRRRRHGQPHRRVGHVVGLQHRQPHRDDEVGAVLLAGDAGDPACSRSARWSRPACR